MIRLRDTMAALSGAAFFVGAAHADLPVLHIPLACDIGDECVIQQYMDRDPGPEAHDFRCGPLSYNDHSGTDFRLRDFAAMAAGLNVWAATSGTVRAVRTSAPDTGRDGMTPGQDCGNGVVIDHDDGWQTQYCHMRQDTIIVDPGQSVLTGDVLGQVGYSGNTEFPHLHFTVRHNGETVDPFALHDTCGTTGASLWGTEIPYHPGGILTAGFAAEIPSYEAIQAGEAGAHTLPEAAPALVIWGYMFGSLPGDELQLSIHMPDGSILHDRALTLDRQQAQLFRASGLRARSAGWPLGTYRGVVRRMRNGVELDQLTTDVTIN